MSFGRIAAVLRQLAGNGQGSVITEFALLAPTVLTLMLGVFQVGIGMQNYNAMRAISFEVMRYAVVNYQTNNQLSNELLEYHASSVAISSAYGLDGSKFEPHVSDVTNSRVTGTIEKTITLNYTVPTFLTIIGLPDIPLQYSQSLFLTPRS